jgi:hypothetical protein
VITRGGITTDLLRNLLCEEDLPPKLLAARIPPYALATVDDPTVVMIASTAPLMSLSSTATHNRYRFISHDSRQKSTPDKGVRYRVGGSFLDFAVPSHGKRGLRSDGLEARHGCRVGRITRPHLRRRHFDIRTCNRGTGQWMA